MKWFRLIKALCFLIISIKSTIPVYGQSDIQNDIIKYEICVHLDDSSKMLHGKETIEWLNTTNDEIEDMYFHMYWNAFKNEFSSFIKEALFYSEGGIGSVSLRKAEDAGWIDITKMALSDGTDITKDLQYVAVDEPLNPDDQTVLYVKFPVKIKPGQKIILNIDFEAKIPKVLALSGYHHNLFFMGQWFPKPGIYEEGKGWNCHNYHNSGEFFAEFAEFTVHITLPDKYILGSSGKQINEVKNTEDGTITYTYWQDHIHDFAWVADPDFIKIERDFIAEKEISIEEYKKYADIHQLSIDEIKLNNVKMILLINPEHQDQIEKHFETLIKAIKYFGLWYGKYPYETITMVDPAYRSGIGGMEYPTLFTTGTRLFQAEGEYNAPGLPGLIVHEYGHNYWQGMCANNEFEEAWLDEGIVTYLEGKVLNHIYGPSYVNFTFSHVPITRYFNNIKVPPRLNSRIKGILFNEYDAVNTFSFKFHDPRIYNTNVYSRASTVLNTLENILGEELMMRFLRNFQMTYRFKHPTTDDFFSVLNETTGRDFTWFRNAFIESADEFDYAVSMVRSDPIQKHARGYVDTDNGRLFIDSKMLEEMEGSDTATTYLSRVRVRRVGSARIGGDYKLILKVMFEDSTIKLFEWDGQRRWNEFKVISDQKIEYAHLDPEQIYLIDCNLSNNSMLREPELSGVVRWSSKIMFWIQNIMQILAIIS